jgi:pristinamycin I synthase-3/4
MSMDTSEPTRAAEADGRRLHELFASAAARVPERAAVVCGAAEIRYGELDRRSDRLASFLRRRGAGAEVRVGLCVERSIDMVTAVLGVLKAGAAYVPLDPELPPARLTYIFADSGASLVLTQEALRPRLGDFQGEVICLDRDPVFELVFEEDAPGGVPLAHVFPESLAYVVYTSGSTGRPKGVLSTHLGAVSYLRYVLDTYELGPADRVLQLASLAFDASVRDLLGPLAAGATVVLAEPGQAKDPWALLKLIEGQRITRILSIVPTLLRTLLEAAEAGGTALRGDLRTLLVSGERLYLADCERARKVFGEGVEVVNQYGPTECTMTSTYHRVRLPGSGRAEVLIGRPIPGCRLHLFQDGAEVPEGTEGELGIAGPGLARGYLGQPDLTADKFRPDPFGAIPGARLYTTGDRVRRLPDGDCEFIGRVDHQVKLRGVRIELSEIERELLALPGVRQAAALLREDKPGEPRLVAYVVPPGKPAQKDELRELLEQRLPGAMIPSDFVFLEALPVTPNGKLDRRALPAPAEPGKAAGEAPQLKVDRARAFELLLQKKGLRKARPGAIPRREGKGPSVLSFQQERLWFFSRVYPASAAYNMPMALRLTGRLDLPALERTLSELVRRHESLRTTFHVLDGRPVQVVSPPAAQPLPRVDLRPLPESAREREAYRLAQAEARRPFDLSADLPFRSSLLVLAADEHLLILIAHHISSDGWSGGLLGRELGALYQAFSANRPSPLPELEIQYPDFAEWQRRTPAGPALSADLEYWKGRLAGLPQLELPTDRPRPDPPTLRGAQRMTSVPAPLLEDLQALARSRESTLFMLLLAALFVLLRHHSGQEDIAVGTPVAGRKHPQTESLIGFFVDWLVLRADLSREPTIGELLDRVRALTLEAFARQEPPFQKVIEEIAPERDLNHSPLFRVALNLQSAIGMGFSLLQLPGLELAPVELGKPAANLDLSLYVLERPGEVGLSWVYKADLFEVARIARWTGHFESLLRAWVGDPARRISDVALLGAAEEAQLQVDRREPPEPSRTDASRPAVAPRTAIERELASIWRDVLAVEPIGVRDSFFKLGGHSVQAALMMARVQARFGRALPLEGLFRGDTIEDLARKLQAGPEEETWSPLIPLRPAGPRPPFFAIHPAGGTVACYDRLAGHLGSEQPFLALQARGLTAGHEPCRRIEDMASLYVQAVRAEQPRGPYYLGGWSFGGLVAYEMALQLEAAGEEVALLALIDTHAPGRRSERDLDDARLLARLGREIGLTLDKEERRRFLKVYKASLNAAQEYRPAAAPLAGPVVLLSAGDLSPEVAELAAADPCRGWSRYAARPIRVHTISGNHFSMIQEPAVRELAEVLERSLEEATCPYSQAAS